MQSHRHSSRLSSSLFLPLVGIIAFSFLAQPRSIDSQDKSQQDEKVTQQPGSPPANQPQRDKSVSQQGPDPNIFPSIKDAQISEFDTLPKAAQEETLASKGPLLPKKYNTSNFTMRVFLKGNSPLFIDYALQPGCSALVTMSVEGVEPVTNTLTSGADVRSPSISGLAELSRTGGDTPERVAKATSLLIEDFLRHIEKGRASQVIQLPASFGEATQVGRLSVLAFCQDASGPKPAFFRLYGLGLGNRAVARNLSVNWGETRMSNHAPNNADPLDGRTGVIDRIRLNPGTITAGLGRKVKYEFHSRSDFFNVAALFNRDEDVGNISIVETMYYRELGSVTEGGSIRPGRGCTCDWDGNAEGGPSRGWHSFEVRAWQNTDDREWTSARSYPRKVLVR